MSQQNRHEQQFLNTLRDVFVGAQVEGESGYINLMRIKSRYYTEGVFPRLIADINAACQPFDPAFREELFDKLYDFFNRYFSESGSIYFRRTAYHNNVYERVYTDDRDVMLFWKTHMLYYVKTDRLFNSMEVDVDGTSFRFDVSGLEHKRANEKRQLVYSLKSAGDGRVVLGVAYAERNRKTKADDIRRALGKSGVAVDEGTLTRATRIFEKQSEVDYFINKNARAFLREQFDLWLYQYVFAGDTVWTETRLSQLMALKTIAYKIIDFIAQFEDELVKVWNKPKFVLNSHYIITLDKISDAALRERLGAHAGMAAQVAEWRALGMVGDGFTTSYVDINTGGIFVQPDYRFLPLDTRYFPDLELDILALFDDLDEALDGWLIHSENYQALNTIQLRFRRQVEAIYIDPPYNKGGDDFVYLDKYRHSTWLSLMADRIRHAKELMSSDAIALTAIDDVEAHNLMSLQRDIYGSDHFVGVITWEKRTKAQNTETARQMLQSKTEYIQVFRTKTGQQQFNLEQDSLKTYDLSDEYGPFRLHEIGQMAAEGIRGRETMIFSIRGVMPRPNMQWKMGSDEVNRLDTNGRLVMQGNKPMVIFRPGDEDDSTYKPFWSHFFDKDTYGTAEVGLSELKNDLGFGRTIETVKPVRLITKLLYHVTNTSSLVLDYFAGSGTTAHSVISLNKEDKGKRKYILVEMGDYFHTLILPRIKKVVYSDKWKDGQAQAGQGISHFAKYYDLEQYEDTLRRAHYEDTPLLAAADAYGPYAFLRDLRLMVDTVTLDTAADKVNVRLDDLYPNIDLAETLSCVTGKGIRRITREAVEFQDGTTASLTEPDWTLLKPLLWW